MNDHLSWLLGPTNPTRGEKMLSWLIYKGFNGKGIWPFRLFRWKEPS